MTGDPYAFAAAARVLVGSRFRLRGRDPATGIDCVGLVICALLAIGRTVPRLPHYTLRNTETGPLLGLLPAAGFRKTSDVLKTGDLVIARPSPGQLHLAVAENDESLIHAHAGLGRVVATPASALLSQAERWRLI